MRHRFHMRWHAYALFLAVLAILPPMAAAFDGQVVRSDGAALQNAEVSVVGRSGSARTDAGGRFRLEPDPPFPFTLIIIGPRGEIYDPVEITEASQLVDIRVRPGVSESITVSTGVAPNIEAPPAAATVVLGREDLEQRKPEHLVDALERTPGVQRRGEGPSAVPVVRGLTGGRTLILVDDARVTAERRAGASGTFLDPFTLAAVELARGAGSVAYGSDAFGGVIHARPRDPVVGENSLRYDVSAAAGGAAFRSAGFEITHDLFGGAVLAVIHGRESDGSEAADGEEIFNSAYADRGAGLRFIRNVGNAFFRFGIATNQGRDIQAPAGDSRVTSTYYPEEDSTRVTFGLDIAGTGTWEAIGVRGAAGAYDITTVRDRLPTTTVTRQISSSDVTANDASLRVTVSRTSPVGRVQAGVDLVSRFNLHADGFVQRFDSSETPTTRVDELSIDDASKFDGGVFAIVESSPTSRLMLNGGIRGDYIEVENGGGFFGDRERSDSALSGHVSATYAFASALTTTIQLSRGFREPTLSDRYFRGISGRGFVVGNPELEPEKSLQFDSALRWQRGIRSVALFAYQYRITDLIERFRAGSDFNFRNRGEADIRGAEIEFTAPLALGFALQGGAAIARGEARDDDMPLDDIGAPTINLEVRWGSGRLTTFLHGLWVADDERPGPLEEDRPSYSLYDAGFGWKFGSVADVRLHARNLLDKRYAGSADENAALAPGRSISISLHGRL